MISSFPLSGEPSPKDTEVGNPLQSCLSRSINLDPVVLPQVTGKQEIKVSEPHHLGTMVIDGSRDCEIRTNTGGKL